MPRSRTVMRNLVRVTVPFTRPERKAVEQLAARKGLSVAALLVSLGLVEWERQKRIVRARKALEETERKDDDDDALASLRNATWRRAARGAGMSIGKWARRGLDAFAQGNEVTVVRAGARTSPSGSRPRKLGRKLGMRVPGRSGNSHSDIAE